MLPCKTCKAECCNRVPASENEIRRITYYLETLGEKEVLRLARQKREPLTCPFVDTEKWNCAVYEVRPIVCKWFGETDIEELHCPKTEERGTWCPGLGMELIQIELEMDKYERGRGALLGVGITWDSLLPAATKEKL